MPSGPGFGGSRFGRFVGRVAYERHRRGSTPANRCHCQRSRCGKAIITAWCQAFPQTSKVMLIGSEDGMARTIREGYGWRADCLGDLGGFSKTWNHMDNYYPQQLAKPEPRKLEDRPGCFRELLGHEQVEAGRLGYRLQSSIMPCAVMLVI